MAAPVVRFPIVMVVRAMGALITTLVLVWALHFRGGMSLISENKDLIFNVHPVLMVIGLILLNGEGKKVPLVTADLRLQLLFVFCFLSVTIFYPLRHCSTKYKNLKKIPLEAITSSASISYC